MNYLTPSNSNDNVPQLEITTPDLAGPGGPMNSQAQALLNKLTYLSDIVAYAYNTALSGTPTAPTAAVGTLGTQLATCQFVISEISNDITFLRTHQVTGYYASAPTSNLIIGAKVFASVANLPLALAGSYAISHVAATASTTFTISKNGTPFGSFNFAPSATTATFSGPATSFAPGDIITVVAPATADSTLSGVAYTLLGTF